MGLRSRRHGIRTPQCSTRPTDQCPAQATSWQAALWQPVQAGGPGGLRRPATRGVAMATCPGKVNGVACGAHGSSCSPPHKQQEQGTRSVRPSSGPRAVGLTC